MKKHWLAWLVLMGFAAQAHALMGSVTLRASHGQFVCAENGGGSQLVANRNVAGPWETFTMDDLNGGSLQSGDEITLRALNSQYVTAEGGGGGIVIPNRGAVGPWERFRIHKVNGSGLIDSGAQVALQASNAQYFTIVRPALRPPLNAPRVVANRGTIGATEIFTINITWSTALAPPIPSDLVVSPAPGGAPATLSAHATDADGDLKSFMFWYQTETEPWWHHIANVAISGADAWASQQFIPPVTQGRVLVHVGVYDANGHSHGDVAIWLVRDCPILPGPGPFPVEGFGAQTLGGWQTGGDEYWVTNFGDSGPGSLREGTNTGGRPRIIRFARPGVIELQSVVDLPSNITVDGRNSDVRLHGKGLRIAFAEHVIVTHLAIYGVQPVTEDGIQLVGSRNVVLDHLWLYQESNDQGTSERVDEAISIVAAVDRGLPSGNITIAWNRFETWEKAILLGNGQPGTEPLDGQMTVTIHHNFFRRTGRRHPEARYGRFDVYNNYLSDWQMLDSDGLAGNSQGDSFGTKCRDQCRLVLEKNVYARQEHFRNTGTSVNNASWCESGGVIEDRGRWVAPWNQKGNQFGVGCPAIGSAFEFPAGHVRTVEAANDALVLKLITEAGSVRMPAPTSWPPPW